MRRDFPVGGAAGDEFNHRELRPGEPGEFVARGIRLTGLPTALPQSAQTLPNARGVAQRSSFDVCVVGLVE